MRPKYGYYENRNKEMITLNVTEREITVEIYNMACQIIT